MDTLLANKTAAAKKVGKTIPIFSWRLAFQAKLKQCITFMGVELEMTVPKLLFFFL